VIFNDCRWFSITTQNAQLNNSNRTDIGGMIYTCSAASRHLFSLEALPRRVVFCLVVLGAPRPCQRARRESRRFRATRHAVPGPPVEPDPNLPSARFSSPWVRQGHTLSTSIQWVPSDRVQSSMDLDCVGCRGLASALIWWRQQ
jgi:hypothetical protein